MSEQIKLQHLLDNLKPSIKLKVIEKNPKTVAEFLEYSKTVEDLNTLISRDQNLSHFVSDNLTVVANNVSSPTIGSQTYVTPPRRSNHNNQSPHHHNSISNQIEPSYPTNESSTQPQSSSQNYSANNYNSNTNHQQRQTEAFLGGDASGHHNIQNPSLMFISACVNKSPMKLMIDTGATNTLITEKALLSTHHKKFTSKYPWKLYQADGQTPLEVVGVVQLQIQIKSTNTNISAYVVKHLCTPCLLGTDYINKYKFKIDAGAQTITIINNKDEITTNIIKHSHSIRLPVRLINPVIVPPYENRNVLVSTDISTATTIFQPSFKLIQRTPILLSNNFLNVRNYRTYILIQNPSSFPQYLSKNLFVGTIQLPQFSDTLCASSSMERNNDPNSVAETNIHNLLVHLTDESQKHELKETFDRYRKIFDTLTPNVANSTICHAINTINHPPPSSKP
ncbi:unnamed protein product [Didymodactylos carnosus]|uniref:Peptidase A2 domain-containing protein n=1 Tax=Didymodactylos carnosus TaxID=1234261 RepID=A0A8S2VXD5_9BILA|nr:unnamed protein product [Didymodactylos carnosus]